MPLTAKEKMRRYRERLKAERPEAYEAQRKKNLERIKSKKKKICELTVDDAEKQRQKWREEKRKSRMKGTTDNKENYLNESLDSVAKSTEADIDLVINLKTLIKEKKRVLRLKHKNIQYKSHNRALANLLKKEKLKSMRYKKRLQRTQDTSIMLIQKLQSEINKMKAREEILESTLTKTYKNCKTYKEKRVLKGVVVNSKPPYRKYVTQMIGLKGKARQKLTKSKIKEIEEIKAFYLKDDVSRNTAGKKECKTKGKQKKQIRYLLESLRNLYKKYKEEGGRYGFTTFFKQKPFYVLSPRIQSRETCLCIKHANIGFQFCTLRRHGLVKQSLSGLLEQLVCDVKSYSCMYNECNRCKSRKINISEEEPILQKEVHWDKWEKKNKNYKNKDGEQKISKITEKSKIQGTLRELVADFEKNIHVFKKHYFNMFYQQNQYREAVSNLQENEALIICDFSENYDGKMPQEVQARHFSKSQISLHTGMVYWKNMAKSFCTISDNTSHQPAAIWAHLSPIMDTIKEISPEVDVVHIYSDGPSSQYRQKANFFLHSHFTSKYNLKYSTWSFFKAGHGKSVADGIGGCVKRALDKQVCYGFDINNANDANNALIKSKIRVQIHIIPENKVEEIESLIPKNLPVLKGTMKLHQVIATANANAIKYRDLSCFCGLLRGCCSCLSPKIHILQPRLSPTDATSSVDTSIELRPSNLNEHLDKIQILPESSHNHSSPTVHSDGLADLVNIELKPARNDIPKINLQDEAQCSTNAVIENDRKSHILQPSNTMESREMSISTPTKRLIISKPYVPIKIFKKDLKPIPETNHMRSATIQDVSSLDLDEMPVIILSKPTNNKEKTPIQSKVACHAFVLCANCNTSILGKKGRCIACKRLYCSECAGQESFAIDYICDACLEQSDSD